jgi:hypothetical protein
MCFGVSRYDGGDEVPIQNEWIVLDPSGNFFTTQNGQKWQRW